MQEHNYCTAEYFFNKNQTRTYVSFWLKHLTHLRMMHKQYVFTAAMKIKRLNEKIKKIGILQINQKIFTMNEGNK